MPFIGSFRSASGVVDGGERGLNVGGVCCLTVVGDGGGPFQNEEEIYQKFGKYQNKLDGAGFDVPDL
jgi:hypothetical protein